MSKIKTTAPIAARRAPGGNCRLPNLRMSARPISKTEGRSRGHARTRDRNGGDLYTQGKYGQAERVCRQIIAARPSDADAHNILGVALNAAGKAEEGIEQLRRAAELAPSAAGILSNLGEILRQDGQTEEAAKILKERSSSSPAMPRR